MKWKTRGGWWRNLWHWRRETGYRRRKRGIRAISHEHYYLQCEGVKWAAIRRLIKKEKVDLQHNRCQIKIILQIVYWITHKNQFYPIKSR